MSVQLTRDQQAVVDDRGGPLLVSAAAGSGKTRVLVDRLFKYVLGDEQANVDDFLIITYTRASAAELRERIAQELQERMARAPGDKHLQKQLLLIYQADIKTIDSFCTALLRENVHLLDKEGERGLTADFRVMDESEADLMERRVLPRVLEEFYTDMGPGERLLADSFGFGRDDSRLEELILNVYEKIQSHAYPEKWLLAQREVWESLPGNVGDTPYGRELLLSLERKAAHWASVLRESIIEMACDQKLQKGYGDPFAAGAEQLEDLRKAASAGWDQAREVELQWPRLGSTRGCEAVELKNRCQSQWNQCKKEMARAVAILDAPAEESADDLKRVAPAMIALLELVERFSHAYREEKLRRNATDFSDQEHAAVTLLLDDDGEPTELARQISSRYREVMVDEYQDTNQVQNCIFTAVSGNGQRLFTVGDVKQSIYRFRLADPTIFLQKYMAYPLAEHAADGEARKIVLSQNFRSRKSVLDAANFVFRAIMSKDMGEMDYGDAEQLNFGASYLPEGADDKTEFHLLEAVRGSGEPSALVEARFVAKRIRRLLDEKTLVASEDGGLRPCRPEDIVVLMRSPGPRLKHYTAVFAAEGIPCSTQENEDFFASMEVAVAVSMLDILDNPRQDVPLISVLRSPVFGFTPDRLAVIRGKWPKGDFYDALTHDEGEDSRGFLEWLGKARIEAKDQSVHRILWQLYDRWNMLGVFGAMSGGQRRQENLIALTEHARSFEGAGYKGLFAFTTHLRNLLENGQQPLTSVGGAQSGVRIMSIHKSKGLEFPIVILADLNKSFNKMDLQAPVLVSPELGLGPMYIDLDRRIRYPTAAHRAIASRLSREMKAEEMRVLYVAMTRAKEKLIMAATVQGAGKKLGDLLSMSSLPVPPETVDSAKTMAEWLLMALLQRPEARELRQIAEMEEGLAAPTVDAPWEVSFHSGEELAASGEMETAAQAEVDLQEDEEQSLDIEALGFKYPYRAAATAPAKLTATQLKGREKDEEIAEETVQPYVRREFAPPRFLSGTRPLTATQKGTATHTALQYLALDGDPEAVVRELVARKLLTPEQGEAVNVRSLKLFLRSTLAEELRQAQRVEREYRFSLLVPAADYYEGVASEDQVLLQGVVDLFAVTEDGLLVVDFKTDYVTPENMEEKVERYRGQLTAYSKALEHILGLPVRRKVLYFLGTGQTVEV